MDQGESGSANGLDAVLTRNIRTLLAHRRTAERRATFEERVADRITRFTGSMVFVYAHLVFFSLWILANAGWLFIKPFDPTFVMLSMLASVEAIFLSTFILISQNRMSALSEKRADLDLQISLLAEHEVTRILQLVSQIAKQNGINLCERSDLMDLQQDVSPENLLSRIEAEEERSPE